jgi:hypothetical protein
MTPKTKDATASNANNWSSRARISFTISSVLLLLLLLLRFMLCYSAGGESDLLFVDWRVSMVRLMDGINHHQNIKGRTTSQRDHTKI